MAPDSKHRKDPTDPHLKFMTRSRRLILVTRDHMNSVSRISAEIHEISQSILAEHDEFLRARSNLAIEDDTAEEEDDLNIQREVSFDVSKEIGNDNKEKNHEEREHQQERHLKIPIRYPALPNLKLHTPRDQRENESRKMKIRHITKLPSVPKVPWREKQNISARIYQNPQVPYIPHKPSPRIKQAPADSHKAPTIPRLNLHKLLGDGKKFDHLPVVINKPILRRKSALEKKPTEEKVDKIFPVIVKHPLPVYKAPTLIMQPPGYAPRFELRLPRLENKDNVETKNVEKSETRERSAVKKESLPEIVLNNSSFQARSRTVILRTNISQQRPPTRDRDKPKLSVSGKTLKEVIIPGRRQLDSQTTSRTVSRDGDRRKTLKRKETVILPKVNPCPLMSPDYKTQHFHRPSYLITSPVPTSHLAPTASLESCMSVSPMPHIHQMTLTPRQTMLISGSPTNFLSTSRPGSMIRETPVQGTITRLPKLVPAGAVSSGH